MYFLIATLLVEVVSFFYTYYYSREQLLAAAKKDAENLTQLTVARIENILQPVEQIPKTLALSLDVPKVEYREIYRQMRDFVRDNPIVYGSILAFEPYAYSRNQRFYATYFFEGKDSIREKIQTDPSYNYFTYEWYSLPRTLDKPVWTEPYYDKGGGDTLMCTFSVPFYRTIQGKKNFMGVITMDISLSSFDEIVSSVHVFRTGFGFLVSRNGKIINFPDPKIVNKDFYEFAEKNDKTLILSKRMMKGQSGFEDLTGLVVGQEEHNWLYFSPVPSTGWSLGIIIPEKELFSDLIGLFYRFFGIFLVSILAIFLITILITRKFTYPISRLASATLEIGKGNFNAPLPVYRSRDEISQLSNSFLLMQEELNNYIKNLRDATAARERIESELKVAREIQLGMLPAVFPVRDDFEIYALLESAREVGGDLYDFFFPDPVHLFVAVGDVSGKGVPASLFMAVTRTLFRARIVPGASLCGVMQDINNELNRENPNHIFVTFLAGILDLRSGEVELCNAGHNPPLVIRNNGTLEKSFPSGNIPLGIFPGTRYSLHKIRLSEGDVLVLYTDGITEATSPDLELYKEYRLVEFLSGAGSSSLKEIAGNLVKDIKRFEGGREQADDLTLLFLKYRDSRRSQPVPAGAGEIRQMQIRNEPGEIGRIAAVVEDIAASWALDPKTAMEINLILEELVSNIIFYAYEDDQSHLVMIDLRKEKNQVRLTVTDDGKPFNLKEIRDEVTPDLSIEERKIGGLGIHLVRSLADRVDYHREGERNIVEIIKKCS
jgi:sigma-B regulation protein RsbU (phosphoserine phosphatase)